MHSTLKLDSISPIQQEQYHDVKDKFEVKPFDNEKEEELKLSNQKKTPI